MRITHYHWPVIVLAALLGLGDFAESTEPVAGEKIKTSTAATRTRASQEARGLLANRFSSSAAASSSSASASESLANQVGRHTFEQASWTSGLNDSAAARMSLSDHCDSCDCCPDPLWVHRSGVFADLLVLRPGNIDYIYAVEQTGTLPTDSPTGPLGRVGFDTAVGYRIGVNHCLSDCSSIQASYTWFQDGTNNTIVANPGTVLIFQPGVPSIPNVGASSIQASAQYDIRFQQLDIDYRGLLYGTCDSAVNYFAGFRYANLDQRFSAQEDVGAPVGLTSARTEINFDGFGIGFGLDGIRRSSYSGLLIYGRASSSFVAGEVKADYLQTSQFGPNSIVGNQLVDYRILTILQTELGLGWQSHCGRIRATVGWQVAGWFNALTTPSYIPGVQNRRFDNLDETITFDGLVTRLEWRF